MDKEFILRSRSCVYLLICCILFGCNNKRLYDTHRKVYIENKNGRYTLIRNGKPYQIKGVSGHSYLKKLHEIGGNTIRTYDTANLDAILNEAAANDLTVVVGLPIMDNRVMAAYYDDPKQSGAQLATYRRLVEKYRNHPAVLMWCMGNELEFKLSFKYRSFFKAYNQLVDMVHEIDPDHPVITTVMDLPPKNISNIFNIKTWTNTDMIAINSFGGLRDLQATFKKASWFWKEPYMILEWGIKGPWRPNEEKTSWESYVEPTSTKKAEQYLKVYTHDLPQDDPRLLGTFAFYWGEKQEYTPTWYSMFYDDGTASEVVGILQHIWTGKWPEHTAPKINYMLVDKKGAMDNLIYKPGKTGNAQLLMLSPDSTITNVKWELYPEDWYVKDNVKNQKKLLPIDSAFLTCNQSTATFKTPSQEGPYRLYATVFDKFGNFATCNTPFYVVK